ncbi:MAG: DEAD/DEAH box helicase, partial [Solirubrobacterales bacterium]
MASVTDAASAASLPPSAEIERAEAFARERFVLEGEDAESALAAGTARREALDAALSELADGATEPSIHWRQNYSLLLGLERLLLEPEPVLDDGTSLNAHQVDALSGTLAALSTELQAATARSRNGARIAPTAPDVDEEAEAAAAVAAARREADRTTVVREAAVELEPASEPEPDDALDEELAPLEDDDLDLEDDEDLEEFETAPPDLDDEADAEPDDELEAVAEIGTEEADDDVEPETLAEDEEPLDWDPSADEDDEIVDDAPDDPGASRRFWFEHATGAGKSVAAVGFVAASQTGGVLILTHRRNLVDQFIGEISSRGYGKRLSPPLLRGQDRADGPVTVETYQWFVRNAGKISDAYSIVICDEAHTALGEKTSHSIRAWTGPVFIGMTATGALIARHVADLFPTQTSRFDLAQAARRGVISPLRCVRIPPGPGVRTIAKVPLRKGEVDQDFDQEELAALLDQAPFNLAIADLYKSRFRAVPGVVYTAGVQHAKNVAAAMQAAGIRARAVSGETPKRELAAILAAFERGEVDVLCNAQLLAEGWNSPRATLCMHLAPTASRRIYQQRVGRVTRRNPGKEAGLVVDLVHPATTHDETIVTLHILLDRDVYRGGAIVVGPVRRGRVRKVRVERRVLPVSNNPEKRVAVLEREIWRVAVENLDWAEQHV